MRELRGEGPAVLGWPSVTAEAWRTRLSVLTNSLLVEAQKHVEDNKVKRAKEAAAMEKLKAKRLAVAERAAKIKETLAEGSQLASQLANLGKKFSLADLSKKAKEAIEKSETKVT